jgi:hypothetical protein
LLSSRRTCWLFGFARTSVRTTLFGSDRGCMQGKQSSASCEEVPRVHKAAPSIMLPLSLPMTWLEKRHVVWVGSNSGVGKMQHSIMHLTAVKTEEECHGYYLLRPRAQSVAAEMQLSSPPRHQLGRDRERQLRFSGRVRTTARHRRGLSLCTLSLAAAALVRHACSTCLRIFVLSALFLVCVCVCVCAEICLPKMDT